MKTRLQILLAAERLFAEHGVDGVALRAINRLAGQKNQSALHYYFGSRDKLLEAIIAFRMPPINERRLQLLHEVENAGVCRDVRTLCWVMVQPLAETVACSQEQNNWVRFLAQVYSNSQYNLANTVRRQNYDASLRKLARKVRSALPDIPRHIVDQRLVMSMRQIVHTLADWERGVLEYQGGASVDKLDIFISNLIDMTAGALAAKASPESCRLWKAAKLQHPDFATLNGA